MGVVGSAIAASLGRPGVRGLIGAQQQGKLLQIVAGEKHPIANVAGITYSLNPAGNRRASNPSSVETSPAGLAVTDEAANELLLVSWNGGVSVLATFPPTRTGNVALQSMPTSVAFGPDKAYYVGELAGGEPGTARIWRVVQGQAPSVWRTGFTAISGLDFGPDGSLYVSELAKHGLEAARNGEGEGALIRIAPNGRRTAHRPRSGRKCGLQPPGFQAKRLERPH